MIEPCVRGVGAKAAAQSTAIAMDAIAKPARFSTFLGNFSQDKCAAASVSAHLPTPNSDIAYMYEVGFLLHIINLYF
jgi:hypothetical protein